MLEMLKTRKEALQERGVKGFTLMEMLIVIAIIAVLVAIAIPVLGAQLEKARDTTSVANMRSAYAEASVKLLEDEFTKSGDNKVVEIADVAIETESANDWSDQADDLPFTAPTDPGSSDKKTMVFTWDKTDKLTVTFKA